jgi:hypothetical protein
MKAFGFDQLPAAFFAGVSPTRDNAENGEARRKGYPIGRHRLSSYACVSNPE